MSDSVKDLKLRISSTLDGKATLSELELLLKEISLKLKDVSQSSSNFKSLSKSFETVNAEVKKLSQNVEAVTKADKIRTQQQQSFDKMHAEAIQRNIKLDNEAAAQKLNQINQIAKAQQSFDKMHAEAIQRNIKLDEQYENEINKRAANVLKGATQTNLTTNKQSNALQLFDSKLASSQLATLKNKLSSVQAEMDLMARSVGRGSEAYQALQAKAGSLSKEIIGLNRNFKGLNTEVKASSHQILETLENFTVATAGFRMAIGQITNNGKEMVKMGMEQEEFRDHFKGSAKDLEDLRNVTGHAVKDVDLYRVANKNLGLSLEQEKILLGLARQSVLEHGGTIEEAFQREELVTEGRQKGLQSLNIEQAKFNQILDDKVQKLGGSIDVEKNEDGEIINKIKGLNEVTQKRLRYEALIEASGKKLSDLVKVEQSDKEKLDAIGISVDNAKAKIGIFVGETLVGLISHLGLTNDKAQTTAATITVIGGSVVSLIPLLAQLKIAFGATFTAAAGTVGYLVVGLAATAAQIYAIDRGLKYIAEHSLGITSIEHLDELKKDSEDNKKDLEDKVKNAVEQNAEKKKIWDAQQEQRDKQRQKGIVEGLQGELDKKREIYNMATTEDEKHKAFVEWKKTNDKMVKEDEMASYNSSGTGKKPPKDNTTEQDILLEETKLEIELHREKKDLSNEILDKAIETLKVKRDELDASYQEGVVSKENLQIGNDLLTYTKEIHSLEKDIDDIWTKRAESRKEMLQAERNGHAELMKSRLDYANQIIAIDSKISQMRISLIQNEIEKKREQIQQNYQDQMDAIDKQEKEQASKVHLMGFDILINTPEQIEKFNEMRKLAEMVKDIEIEQMKPMFVAMNEVINTTTNSISGLFEALSKGDPAPFKGFLKSIAMSAISAAELLLLSGTAASFFKAILTGGASLPTDIGFKIAGLIALQAAKGLIAGLAEGTSDWQGGTAWTGEKGIELALFPSGSAALLGVGGPHLADLPAHTKVIPNQQLNHYMTSSMIQPSSPVSIENYYRIDLNKGEIYNDGKSEIDKYKKAIQDRHS